MPKRKTAPTKASTKGAAKRPTTSRGIAASEIGRPDLVKLDPLAPPTPPKVIAPLGGSRKPAYPTHLEPAAVVAVDPESLGEETPRTRGIRVPGTGKRR